MFALTSEELGMDEDRSSDHYPVQDGVESPGRDIDIEVDDSVMLDSVPDGGEERDFRAVGGPDVSRASEAAGQHDNGAVRVDRNGRTQYR